MPSWRTSLSGSASSRPETLARGGIVLLAGDAGVGKTRLLTALRDRALDLGWQVVAGHCLDFADSALPYLPFSEILGRLQVSSPEVLASVASHHPALHRLAPGRRMIDEGGEGASGPGPASAPTSTGPRCSMPCTPSSRPPPSSSPSSSWSRTSTGPTSRPAT